MDTRAVPNLLGRVAPSWPLFAQGDARRTVSADDDMPTTARAKLRVGLVCLPTLSMRVHEHRAMRVYQGP